MFCYSPKHCFRLIEGQQSASWRINFVRFRCGDRIRTRDSRTEGQGANQITTLTPTLCKTVDTPKNFIHWCFILQFTLTAHHKYCKTVATPWNTINWAFDKALAVTQHCKTVDSLKNFIHWCFTLQVTLAAHHKYCKTVNIPRNTISEWNSSECLRFCSVE